MEDVEMNKEKKKKGFKWKGLGGFINVWLNFKWVIWEVWIKYFENFILVGFFGEVNLIMFDEIEERFKFFLCFKGVC